MSSRRVKAIHSHCLEVCEIGLGEFVREHALENRAVGAPFTFILFRRDGGLQVHFFLRFGLDLLINDEASVATSRKGHVVDRTACTFFSLKIGTGAVSDCCGLGFGDTMDLEEDTRGYGGFCTYLVEWIRSAAVTESCGLLVHD